MSGPITLFDLPSRTPNKCWSLNPWKTRLLLNFKGLDYVTQWTEYPDIKPTLEGHVEPNPKGWAYTLPAVKLANGKHIMESRAIVNQIEKDHPTPSVHLDSPYLARVEEIMSTRMFVACRGLICASVPRNLLNPTSVEYWMPNREAMLDMPCDKFEELEGGDKGKDATAAVFKDMGALLQEKPGPFFDGETVGYADFVWVSVIIFFKRIDENIYQDIVKRSGDADVHNRLLAACAPWTKRDAE